MRAERLGFHSVWLSDHLFYDLGRYGGPPQVQGAFECLTGLAALSLATSRVRLGSLVICNDLRHPALLAKAASTVDVLSGGRLELGMGAGWFEPEYRAAGIPFDPPGVRIGRLAEAVRIVRALLDGEEAVFAGRHYRLDGARCLPRPAQARVPITLGGSGGRIARLAGRLADGFNSAWSWTPSGFGRVVREVDRAAARAGRDPGAVAKTVGLYALPAASRRDAGARWRRYAAGSPSVRALPPLEIWSAGKLVGEYAAIAETIRRFAETGVSEIVLTFGSIPFQIADPEAVDEFMEEVAPLVI